LPDSQYKTILLVEDNEIVRRVASRSLQKRGYTVLEADGSEQAIRLAAEKGGTIDLMLTDVIMPGMNGRQLYERLALTCPQMKVLFMSGYSEEIVVHRGILDEGIQFIEKGFTAESLAQKVRQVLEEPQPVGAKPV